MNGTTSGRPEPSTDRSNHPDTIKSTLLYSIVDLFLLPGFLSPHLQITFSVETYFFLTSFRLQHLRQKSVHALIHTVGMALKRAAAHILVCRKIERRVTPGTMR